MIVHLNNITKTFPDRILFENFSLEIDTGDFWVVLGRSGSGKSTLLRMILGFERPTSGEIVVDGTSLTDFEIWSDNHELYLKKIGYVSQHDIFPKEFDLLDALLFSQDEEIAFEERENRALSLLDELQLSSYANSFITELSGGERRRANLAIALIKRPRILLSLTLKTGG